MSVMAFRAIPGRWHSLAPVCSRSGSSFAAAVASPTAETFSHVVVGAGSAGAVLASRLSEDPKRSVLLLEAGMDTPWWYRPPLISVVHGVLLSKKHNWRFKSEPEPHLNNREIFQPRGRAVGGSSAINGMIWVRGHPEDYNHWAALTGDDRWGYDSFRKYFMRCEDASEVVADPACAPDRGFAGPLYISHNRWTHPLSHAFIKAAEQSCGLEPNPDFNSGVNTHGVGFYELNQKDGVRWHTGTGYLSAKVRARPNLVIRTGAAVRKVLLEDGIARGVEYTEWSSRPIGGGMVKTAAAGAVTLCGGVFNSPQLLMLSGIGPAKHLADLGIDTTVDAPGVGANLQDHLDVGVSFANPSGEALGLSPRALPMLFSAPFQWLFQSTGPLVSNGVDAGGYVASSPSLDRPDLQLHFFPGSFRDYSLAGTVGHQFALNVYLSRPQATGRLWLRSADPAEKPAMVFNFLDSEQDRAALISGVRIARSILQGEALAPFRGEELLPGADANSDEEILDFLRRNTKSAHHPIGTCAMGRRGDPDAVLDSELRVQGVHGLRVCDASAFPTHVTSNPNSTVIAMAERCAELIAEDE